MGAVPVVLFACARNAGRSVAARVLAEHLGGGAVDARSAGSDPAAVVEPMVAAALGERGLSAEAETPTQLDVDVVADADVVVTMGCGDSCPLFPGKRYVDWPVRDPRGKDIATVRSIVDDIEARVTALLADLGVLRTSESTPVETVAELR